MADIESLSFFLLIPFSICFVLVFLVCCFADKLKSICRFPSPIPVNYAPVTSHRRRRSRGRFRTASGYLDRAHPGRSRNSSESSTESGPGGFTVIPDDVRLLIHQGQIICPQTVLENGQVVHYPSQIIPHRVILSQTSHVTMTSQTFSSSSPSLLRTQCQSTPSWARNSSCLPSIKEKAELKSNSCDHVTINVPCDVNSDSTEQRRNIRNLPEIITVDLLSEKK